MEDKADWVELLDLSNRGPHEFFRSLDEINSADPIPLHVHAMRRAWREMELDGILCVQRVPVVYFKEIRQPRENELRKLQRQLWNQSIAPILVVITATEILVYSGLALPAKDDEDADKNNRLVETFNQLADALEIRQFVSRVELGEFFRSNPDSFNPEHKVDQYLLENLDAARDQLESQFLDPLRLDTATVHALLGRTIFTCYLVDRGIINDSYFKKAGADGSRALVDVFRKFPPDQVKKILFKLFRELRSDFNGDVFEGDLDAEERALQPAHIELLGRFLNGDNVVNAQRSLGFWAYDFEFIPIETISGIYESFLVAEAPKKKRESGAYYTPRFLAEVVLNVALEGDSSLLDKRCLDAACGSGIFLVGLFNQMAEEWRRKNPHASYDTHANALINILLQNLFGVDQSLIACRIAAFSLYIALLDQLSPSDIQKLQKKGKFLPHLVALKNGDQNEHFGANVFHWDFFDETLPIDGGFDVVIGNPPWTRPKKGPKTTSERWCKNNGLPIPQRQVAAGFVWKAPRHLRDHGTICFLLPAPLLFSHGKGIDFQSKWFSEYTVEKVINLADMRFYLFPGSIHPAIIVKYKKTLPNKREHYIEYLTPKTEPETLRADILVISPEDRKDLRLLAILNVVDQGEPAFVWKEAFWGTPRDRRFIDRLNEYTKLSDWGNKSKKGWKVDEGFNRGGDGKPTDRAVLHEIPFLPAKAVSAYVILESDLMKEPPTYEPRRMANEAIFRKPHIVFPHGVSRKGKRIKAGFSSFDCSFTQTIRGIHADSQNEDELRFLTCVLASPLALYFFFHTSFNWAIDRPHLLVAEYEAFPFPVPDTKYQHDIIKLAAELHRSIESNVIKNPNEYNLIVKEHQAQLDKLVFSYFNLDSWEEALIEDTVQVWIPSATPRRYEKSIPALDRSSQKHRLDYMNLLLEALNIWAKRSDRRIEGHNIISRDANLGIVSLRKVDRVSPQTKVKDLESSEKLDAALRRLSNLLPEETKSMRLLRNLKIFDGTRLDILKPLARRYWTKTAALNDADEIAAAVLTSSSNEKRYGANQG